MRPGGQQLGHRVGQGLAGGVVHVDFDQHDRLTGGEVRGSVSDDHLGEVGPLTQIGGPGAEPGPVDGHGGHRPPFGDQGGQQRGPRGRGQLDRDVELVGRRSPQQLDHGRSGDGHEPVGAAHHPDAVRHRTGVDLLDAEQFEGGAGTDHVDDGVDAPDFVEVHALGWAAVEMALGPGQHLERGQRPLADAVGQACLFDHAGDVGRGAHHRARLGMDVDLRSGDAGAHDRLGLQAPPTDREPLTQRAHLVDVGTGVDERAERHVPGDA